MMPGDRGRRESEASPGEKKRRGDPKEDASSLARFSLSLSLLRKEKVNRSP
jgi:hypothetical protein